jgi:peptide/nickel transport system ATP-binding protein
VKSVREGVREAVKVLRRVLMPDPEEKVKSYPHELSGGMKQRGVIGISLSTKPKVLIADEPTTAVDVTIQAQLMHLLRDLKSSEGLTLILITHNMGLVAEMCDRVAIMYAGRIVEEAPVLDIFRNPRHPYTKALLRAVVNPLVKASKLESIPGTIPDLIRPPRGCRFHPRCPYFSEICLERPPEFKVGAKHRVSCWLYREEVGA